MYPFTFSVAPITCAKCGIFYLTHIFTYTICSIDVVEADATVPAEDTEVTSAASSPPFCDGGTGERSLRLSSGIGPPFEAADRDPLPGTERLPPSLTLPATPMPELSPLRRR